MSSSLAKGKAIIPYGSATLPYRDDLRQRCVRRLIRQASLDSDVLLVYEKKSGVMNRSIEARPKIGSWYRGQVSGSGLSQKAQEQYERFLKRS